MSNSPGEYWMNLQFNSIRTFFLSRLMFFFLWGDGRLEISSLNVNKQYIFIYVRLFGGSKDNVYLQSISQGQFAALLIRNIDAEVQRKKKP